MVPRGEDGEEGNDVGVVELLEVFEFSDGVGGETFLVVFLDFYLFYGDEFGGVGFDMA